MLFRSIRAEFLKLRRSYVWLAMLILPVLSAGLATANYLNNLGMLTDQWYSLWTQHALFYCALFAPALTGVYCAYVCRLEHLNCNWNAVMTQPIPVHTMLAAKLTVVSVLTALTQILIGVLFILSGKLAGLTNPIPFELLYWVVRGWWALTVQASLLLCIALIIRSFAAGRSGYSGRILRAARSGQGVRRVLSFFPARARHVLAQSVRTDGL